MTELDYAFVSGVVMTLIVIGTLAFISVVIRHTIRDHAHNASAPCETPCMYTHYIWHKKND